MRLVDCGGKVCEIFCYQTRFSTGPGFSWLFLGAADAQKRGGRNDDDMVDNIQRQFFGTFQLRHAMRMSLGTSLNFNQFTSISWGW